MYYSIRLDTEKVKSRVMIYEEICTYEVCKLAKKKGFDVDCEAFYYNYGFLQYAKFENWNGRYLNKFSAPTQSLLQRWLREEKRIEVNAFWDNADNIWLGYAQEMDAPDLVGSFPLNKPFHTYELALEDALAYSLKNLV